MYGYATDETEEMMPLTIVHAHKMNQLLARYRRNGTPALGPSRFQDTGELEWSMGVWRYEWYLV